MNDERKRGGSLRVGGGRIEELRRLAACERALAGAYRVAARSHRASARLRQLGERHLRSGAMLSARIVELGGAPEVQPDDGWLLGRPEQLSTLVYAERTALATYHDHLLDLDGRTLHLVRNEILPAHQEALAALVEEIAPAIEPHQQALR